VKWKATLSLDLLSVPRNLQLLLGWEVRERLASLMIERIRSMKVRWMSIRLVFLQWCSEAAMAWPVEREKQLVLVQESFS
jgi:hypothetical protein